MIERDGRKYLFPDDLPEKLTPEIIDILATMGEEFPQTKEWHVIFDHLDKRGDLRIVLDKIHERHVAEKLRQESLKTPEQKKAEAEFLKKWNEDKTPRFIGNMGEPETPSQFKNKYGVYPPGYDDEGNKIV